MGHYFFTLPLAAFVVSWWAARRWPSSRVLWAGFLGELVVLGVLKASVRYGIHDFFLPGFALPICAVTIGTGIGLGVMASKWVK